MIAFDRFWSIYLTTKVKFKFEKIHLTILILAVFFFVGGMNIIQFWIFAEDNTSYDRISNRTIHYLFCVSSDEFFRIQWLTLILMRVIVPFFLIAILSILLIIKIRNKRKKISSHQASSNSNTVRSPNKQKETRFTIAVCFINGSFLILNLPMLIVAVINYMRYFLRLSFSELYYVQFNLFNTISILLSYLFILCEFWRDLVLNRLFRKEVQNFIYIFSGNRNKVK